MMLFRKLKRSPQLYYKSSNNKSAVPDTSAGESMMRSIEENLNIILHNISEIIYILDENGCISYINEGVNNVGFSPKEVVGMNIFELVHPEDRERSRFHVNERRTGNRGTRGFEVRFVTHDSSLSAGDSQPEIPVYTITAEGRYAAYGGTNLKFAGTVGIAQPVDEDWCGGGDEHAHNDARPFVPICAKCKSIRDTKGIWIRIEEYIATKTGMRFTHSICPSCTRDLYPQFNDSAKN